MSSRAAWCAVFFAACSSSPQAPVHAARPVAAAPFDYPATRREAVVDRYHGVEVPDPYRWLEGESPEITRWLEAQDARTQHRLSGLAEDTDARWRRIQELRVTLAEPLEIRRGSRRFVRAENDTMLIELLGGARVVRFDPGRLPRGTQVTRMNIAPDGARAVVETTVHGADMGEALTVDLDTGALGDRLTGIEGTDIVWHRRGFFYTYTPPETPHAGRFGQRAVRYHAVGHAQTDDRTLVPASGNADDTDSLGAEAVTRDGRRLLVRSAGTWSARGYAVVDLQTGVVTPLRPAGQLVDSACVVGNSILVVGARGDARTLLRLRGTTWSAGIELDAKVIGIEAVGTTLVVQHARGTSTLREFYDEDLRLLSSRTSPVAVTERVAAEPLGREIVIERQGLLVPPERLAYDPKTGGTRQLATSRIPFDVSRFVQTELVATSRDGTHIPLVVVHLRDLAPLRTTPAWMYGYGGFRVSAEQIFYAPWAGWYDGGGIFAQCHGRGGLEYGEAWHLAGAGRNRQNGIDDLVACLEAMHRSGYSAPAHTLLQGWSHGGMMAAAVANQRPELLRMVLSTVPLADMVRFAQFGRGGISEYGDVADADDFAALWAFSPVHRVKAAAYPTFLITAAQRDERAAPMHARKLAAALQHAATEGEILLAIDWEASHQGGGTKDRKHTFAEAASLAWQVLGGPPTDPRVPAPSSPGP